VWGGAKKRDSKSNKETGMEEVESGLKYMLDFKSPYPLESAAFARRTPKADIHSALLG
jgi:hypothetical protein